MDSNYSERIVECIERARRAESCAKDLPIAGARKDSEFLAAQWRSLAKSYALLDRIERTLRDA